MIRNLLSATALAILIASSALAQDSAAPTAPALSVDDLVAKNVQAMGGMEKLKSHNTMRITAKMTMDQGIEAPVTITEKRPNDIRLEFSLQGLTAVQAYNGTTGWQIMPFEGKKDAEPMGEDDLKDIKEQADFDGPLVDYKQKGNKVEYIGKEPVEGSDAYKLKLTLADGTVKNVYLDADTYLEVKEESKRTIRGTEVDTETTLGDYKDEDGIMMPHSMQEGAKGHPPQTITVQKVEWNIPVDDSAFAMPAKAPAATPAAPKKS